MSRSAVVLLCMLGIFLAGGVAAYRLHYPTYTFRFRLTIEVDDNGVIKKGSSVIEETVSRVSAWPNPDERWRISIKGDAVFVDLSHGKNIIATLGCGPRGNDCEFGDIPARAFGFRDAVTLASHSVIRTDATVLEPDNFPTFATFLDLTNPQSVQVVSPDCSVTHFPALKKKSCKTFADVFGPGTDLYRVTIEMTDEPITREITKQLRWLPHPKYLNGGCGASCLHGWNFSR